MRKGGSALKPLLRGSRGIDMCHRLLLAHSVSAALGGNPPARPPARALPRRGNGKGRVQSLLPQAVRGGVVRMPGTWLVYCLLAGVSTISYPILSG